MYLDLELSAAIRKLDRPLTNQFQGYRRGKKVSAQSNTPYLRTADNASASVAGPAAQDGLVKSQSMVSHSHTTASKSTKHPPALTHQAKRVKAISIKRRD